MLATRELTKAELDCKKKWDQCWKSKPSKDEVDKLLRECKNVKWQQKIYLLDDYFQKYDKQIKALSNSLHELQLAADVLRKHSKSGQFKEPIALLTKKIRKIQTKVQRPRSKQIKFALFKRQELTWYRVEWNSKLITHQRFIQSDCPDLLTFLFHPIDNIEKITL